MRLNLSPGDYVLVPGPAPSGEPPAGARPVRVRVVEDRYVPVTVLYRLLARTPGTLR
jgi:hypothetical protein